VKPIAKRRGSARVPVSGEQSRRKPRPHVRFLMELSTRGVTGAHARAGQGTGKKDLSEKQRIEEITVRTSFPSPLERSHPRWETGHEQKRVGWKAFLGEVSDTTVIGLAKTLDLEILPGALKLESTGCLPNLQSSFKDGLSNHIDMSLWKCKRATRTLPFRRKERKPTSLKPISPPLNHHS